MGKKDHPSTIWKAWSTSYLQPSQYEGMLSNLQSTNLAVKSPVVLHPSYLRQPSHNLLITTPEHGFIQMKRFDVTASFICSFNAPEMSYQLTFFFIFSYQLTWKYNLVIPKVFSYLTSYNGSSTPHLSLFFTMYQMSTPSILLYLLFFCSLSNLSGNLTFPTQPNFRCSIVLWMVLPRFRLSCQYKQWKFLHIVGHLEHFHMRFPILCWFLHLMSPAFISHPPKKFLTWWAF